MSTSAGGWLPPLCDSRTGAAHRRRGVPCQDASGLWCVDQSGEPLQLLVVSDGHGGSRYDRSDLGSRLACEVALQEARELLGSAGALAASPDQWRHWLSVDLPHRIVERWRRRVLAHAEAHPRADGAEASTIPYGATLGLLLLTPRWWGCTGLGDWDLVRLDGEGRGQLISEEPDTPGGGEATFSLCMAGAERHFPPRSSVHPIAADAAPFSLLLSTDGIRKSCGSDADFLTLAHYLCGLDGVRRDPQVSELSGALDHISGEGSGDDVSVAIARWDGPLANPERRRVRQQGSQPLIVQPQHRPQAPSAGRSPQATPVASSAEAHPLQAGASVEAAALQTSPQSADVRHGLPHGWAAAAVAVLLVAAAVAAGYRLGLGPFARRPPGPATPALKSSAGQLALLGREARRLCGHEADPARFGRIQATLRQRKALFLELGAEAGRLPPPLPADLRQDPLAGLIAWSALPHVQSPPPFPVCPELREALRQEWQLARSKPDSGAPGRPSSGAPKPARPADPGREQP